VEIGGNDYSIGSAAEFLPLHFSAFSNTMLAMELRLQVSTLCCLCLATRAVVCSGAGVLQI
jgi:hypothetical protein